MKKEWQLTYDVLPDALKERNITETTSSTPIETKDTQPAKTLQDGNFVAVYTAFTDKNIEKIK